MHLPSLPFIIPILKPKGRLVQSKPNMETKILHRDADTTVCVIEKDGSAVVKRVQFRVLSDALRGSSYWDKFLQYAKPTAGFA